MQNKLLIRLSVAGAALTGAAGLGLLALSSAPSALADSCTSPGSGTSCAPAIGVAASASVAVEASTTLTLNTTSISFPEATTAPDRYLDRSGDGHGDLQRHQRLVDRRGVDQRAGSTGAACGDLVGSSNAAPTGSLNDYIPASTRLQVTGGNGLVGFLNPVATPCGQATIKPTDTGTGPGVISDAYELFVPGDAEPDTYTTTLNYTIIGN